MTHERRMTPARRKAAILDAAIRVAERGHYIALSLRNVAQEARCTRPLVLHYFPGPDALKIAVMTEAVAREHLQIIGQGLSVKDRIAMAAGPELRNAAALRLRGSK